MPVPLESQEGDLLVAYLRMKGLTFTHVPNATGHSHEAKMRAISMKRQGTSKGFPDYLIVVPGIGLLAIELKRQRGGVVSPEQQEWIAALNTCPGVQAFVAKGADEAIAIVEKYLPADRKQTGRMF